MSLAWYNQWIRVCLKTSSVDIRGIFRGSCYWDLLTITLLWHSPRKSLTIKDAVYISAQSWNEISSIPLRRAWNKLGFSSGSSSSSSCSSSQEEEVPELSEECDMLGITETEKEQWLATDKCETGVQNMTDEDIIAMVQSGETEEEEEDEDEEPTGPTITHTEAEEAFSSCLAWLEQQDEALA